MEIAVKYILCHILRIRGIAGTAVAAVLNGRPNLLCAADSQDALVVHINTKVVLQVIPDTAVAFVWMLYVYLLYLFCNLLVLFSALT